MQMTIRLIIEPGFKTRIDMAMEKLNSQIKMRQITASLQTCTDPKRAAYLRQAYKDLQNNTAQS